MNKHVKFGREECKVALITASIILLAYSQLEVSSCYDSFEKFFGMEFKYIVLNIFTVAVLLFSISFVYFKMWIGEIIFSIIIFIVSMINYYTIKFHGMPFTVFEIKNFSTAMNVIKSYEINVDRVSCYIIIVTIVNIGHALYLKNFYYKDKERSCLQNFLIRNLCFLLFTVIILWRGYFAENAIKPRQTIGWSWKEAYHAYGYMACSLETISSVWNVIQMPEGYSDDILSSIEMDAPHISDYNTPDIIVILNESFYDLRQVTDLDTDVPYLENFYAYENAIRGFAVIPTTMTNASEYELLTSNSLQLMSGITPFNVLDLSEANSIVSLMKQIGYKTFAMHSEPGLNYSRARAYPALGFDEIHFELDFDKGYFGKRWYATDESLYENLVKWYEQDLAEDAETPKFMYLLTIQNHAEYNFNNSDENIVHVLNDYGEYNEIINEYLSCIYLSDVAFKDLIDYFSDIDRSVIICMVGDHAPLFSEQIVDDKYSSYEKTIRLRTTPFIIWSNCDLDSADVGYVGLNYLMPMIMDISGLPRSPYFQYMINLHENVPVISAFDIFMDTDGNIFTYGQNSEYSEEVNNYFYLEYNNLNDRRIQNIFCIP